MVTGGSARMAGQIPASFLFQSSSVRTTIVHRAYGLRAWWAAVWFAVIFKSPFLSEEPARERPAATSVPDPAALVCHLADTTGVNPATAWPR